METSIQLASGAIAASAHTTIHLVRPETRLRHGRHLWYLAAARVECAAIRAAGCDHRIGHRSRDELHEDCVDREVHCQTPLLDIVHEIVGSEEVEPR